jgi:hypothetical protein
VNVPGQAEENTAQLEELSRRLEDAAARLRSEEIRSEDVKRLAGECAELAAQAAVELDKLARGTSQDGAPGQEELL